MAVTGDPPGDVAKLFATERARLLDLLAAIDERDWGRPTPCPAWTVLELCSHLVGDDLGVLARHRDQHFGTPPPEGSDEGAFIEWLDNLQLGWVAAARRLSPRLAVDLLAWTGPQVVDLFRQQDSSAVSAHVSWAGPEAVPVWLDQVRELSEHWIHRQQLLEALGRPPDLRPDMLGPIMEGLRWAYPYRLREIEAAGGDTVSIDVTGSESVTWHVVRTGAAWEFHRRRGQRVVAHLSMTTDQAWRLLTNNLAAAEVAALPVSGDETISSVLRRTRAIIGSPG